MLTGIIFALVVIAFGVTLYARRQMLKDDAPRPGYIIPRGESDHDYTFGVADQPIHSPRIDHEQEN